MDKIDAVTIEYIAHAALCHSTTMAYAFRRALGLVIPEERDYRPVIVCIGPATDEDILERFENRRRVLV
jgi:hypothetical protein